MKLKCKEQKKFVTQRSVRLGVLAGADGKSRGDRQLNQWAGSKTEDLQDYGFIQTHGVVLELYLRGCELAGLRKTAVKGRMELHDSDVDTISFTMVSSCGGCWVLSQQDEEQAAYNANKHM